MDATKRMHGREKGVYLVLVLRLRTKWHPINGRNQLRLSLASERFVDGHLQRTQPTPK
jgi:hypothetical protein